MAQTYRVYPYSWVAQLLTATTYGGCFTGSPIGDYSFPNDISPAPDITYVGQRYLRISHPYYLGHCQMHYDLGGYPTALVDTVTLVLTMPEGYSALTAEEFYVAISDWSLADIFSEDLSLEPTVTFTTAAGDSGVIRVPLPVEAVCGDRQVYVYLCSKDFYSRTAPLNDLSDKGIQIVTDGRNAPYVEVVTKSTYTPPRTRTFLSADGELALGKVVLAADPSYSLPEFDQLWLGLFTGYTALGLPTGEPSIALDEYGRLRLSSAFDYDDYTAVLTDVQSFGEFILHPEFVAWGLFGSETGSDLLAWGPLATPFTSLAGQHPAVMQFQVCWNPMRDSFVPDEYHKSGWGDCYIGKTILSMVLENRSPSSAWEWADWPPDQQAFYLRLWNADRTACSLFSPPVKFVWSSSKNCYVNDRLVAIPPNGLATAQFIEGRPVVTYASGAEEIAETPVFFASIGQAVYGNSKPYTIRAGDLKVRL